MQTIIFMSSKNLASNQKYSPVQQLTIPGFETPFHKQLDIHNRWVKFSCIIPWDAIVGLYEKTLKKTTGRPALNGRVVMGAMIIKHYCNFSDEETILNIQENMYMQYFCGYSSYDPNPAFDSSLFVEIRDRLGIAGIGAMNDALTEADRLLRLPIKQVINEKNTVETQESDPKEIIETELEQEIKEQETLNQGTVLFDATACPQEIAYPTDLNLLNDSRMKSEEIIDYLFTKSGLELKPRTYRENARKDYLRTAQKKRKSNQEIHVAIGKQLRYLKRNFNTINDLLDLLGACIPLDKRLYRYYLIIQTCYDQQLKMYETKTKIHPDRIVSIHQPHIRPIVRGKSTAKVEFGCKINLSMVDGISFIDELSWDAFNEGSHLMTYIEQFKKRHGFYPKEVLADKIYCTKVNRTALQLLKISLHAKPLGRPKAVPQQHLRPGERNPIEGKFGQAKRAYGMGCIRAKLKQTSEAWVAMIVLVLNLVKLAGRVPLALKHHFMNIIINLYNLNQSHKMKFENCTFTRINTFTRVFQ
jgi:transposase, IS5 family